MKISFDFDSVLAEERMQKVAKKFIKEGHEIWITSSRMNNEYGKLNWNKDLLSVAKKLNIPLDHIQTTNGEDKWLFLKGFDIHFDDNQFEIELIEENLPECAVILILDP